MGVLRGQDIFGALVFLGLVCFAFDVCLLSMETGSGSIHGPVFTRARICSSLCRYGGASMESSTSRILRVASLRAIWYRLMRLICRAPQ